jgi:hypothetical protein
MLKKIKKQLSIAIASVFLALSFGSGLAFGAANVDEAACQGATLEVPTTTSTSSAISSKCSGFSSTDTEVNNIITTVINLFSVIVGVIAVIMIVYGGFRYITSGGDSTKVTASRNTILYAIIGLIVVALAQFIVKFVLSRATSTTT